MSAIQEQIMEESTSDEDYIFARNLEILKVMFLIIYASNSLRILIFFFIKLIYTSKYHSKEFRYLIAGC